ncbi:MAG: hypothetical protein CM1200mP12_08670 [Gammaproteobacteria bacterium]|nr:MAG: hypothetical protein CM1200mP12_08670 [Gammaproteobacteria bacterium]
MGLGLVGGPLFLQQLARRRAGNIWKFPYMAGEYGGGAFVLVYLACILLIGIPIMIAEILIGRRGEAVLPIPCLT